MIRERMCYNDRRVNAVRVKELKYQTNITMKEKLQMLRYELQQKQDAIEALLNEDCTYSFRKLYEGKKSAFAESAQMITDILNSENPNSVSNQPLQD